MQAYPVSLRILDASGNDLTLQTNTVIVGQQMNLTCQLSIADAFMTNFVLTNFSWSVPGFAISNYVVAADASSAFVVTNFPLNNSNAVFYWVDGASNRVVQCLATVNGATVAGQATFNVLRPLPDFFLQNQGDVAADANYSDPGLYLHFGQNIGENFGITMTLTNAPVTNNLFYGAYFVTQLIQTEQKLNIETGTNIVGWQRNRSGLDNQTRWFLDVCNG